MLGDRPLTDPEWEQQYESLTDEELMRIIIRASTPRARPPRGRSPDMRSNTGLIAST
jgi:hypothetical protein